MHPVRGLLLATHAGPTVAVTVVATLLAVTAGVGGARSTPTATGLWRGRTSRSSRGP